MSESGFASLGPSLLARKGGAKPAMRPQVAPLVADAVPAGPIAEEQLEDLGWNDMGHDDDAGGEVVPISTAISPDFEAPGPIIRRQQRRLEERVLADAAMTGPENHDAAGDEEEDYEEADEALDGEYAGESLYAPLAPAPVAAAAPRVTAARTYTRVPAVQSGRRAAFTLRLDADRHLKLRLAATMQGVSAQVLVTEALDRLLAEYDELDLIANHLKRH
ncbi:hypothetical protein [Erythrobacter sp. WG]|uniref:hypothetical protein n=1 Tax=Erythrobacter sp. WG TaxID=2985510 RepID=UPI00226F0FF1|nr:hypothetical protein [Erythrobacter sp. WG]MCX9147821.1 type II toxin-antitoxin system HicB family antitoxin [Erythrobacter sp. WG]